MYKNNLLYIFNILMLSSQVKAQSWDFIKEKDKRAQYYLVYDLPLR